MSAIKLRENIYAVGAIDYDVRIFHGYKTPFGATYNAYLIIDDTITLVDFTKKAFSRELLANIEEICPVSKIGCMIANHIEPDHSGSLPAVAERIPDAPIYCTAGAARGLKQYYGKDFNLKIVKNGDTLSTGRYTFSFIPAAMVHWPDSMLTYLQEEKILFSNDAFGQHIAVPEVYDDDLGLDRLMERAGDYYANIVLPFGPQVEKLLEQAQALDIDMICPSHGQVLRSYIPQVLEGYHRWARNEVKENKTVIVYDTMWGATERLAFHLAEKEREAGRDVHVLDLRQIHPSSAMAEVLEAKYIYIGSSTLNRNLMPTVAAFLTYMKGLSPKGRVGMAFGSYGWSGESVGQIETVLTELGWEILPQVKRVYMT